MRWCLPLIAALTLGCAPATAQWGEPRDVPDHQYMAGDGYHQMGGVEGKNWGVWQSSGAVEDVCEWSIRSVAAGRGADILDEGAAGREKVEVVINPDGSPSVWTGEIDGHRIVFATHGCQPWYWG